MGRPVPQSGIIAEQFMAGVVHHDLLVEPVRGVRVHRLVMQQLEVEDGVLAQLLLGQ
jgi:hypothetical protein